MNNRDLLWILMAAVAVAFPTVTLALTTGEERAAAGLAAPPFAWGRFLVVHLVAAVPLGIVAALALARRGPPQRLLWVALGGCAAWAVILLGPFLAEALANGRYGLVAALLLRSALAWVLVTPWCIALAPAPAPGGRGSWWLALVSLALAVVPPGVYAVAVIDTRSGTAADLLARDRLARGSCILTGLCELGSRRPVLGASPYALQKKLNEALPALRRAAAQSLPPGAPPEAHLQRALLLIQIDRLEDAAAELAPLAPRNVQAALLLATVRRDQERWAESDALYSAALSRLGPQAQADAAARAGCKAALEGLAFNAGADRRPGDAERALRRGVELLPAEAAYFHLQLGRHYQDGGRPAEALEHLRRAAHLDPKSYGVAAEEHIRAVRTQTYGCFLSK